MTLFLSWSGAYARQIAEALKTAIDQLCASGDDKTKRGGKPTLLTKLA